ncbi:MAG: hypothetical protein ACPGQS_06640 [Bradymonadia bacterium]
MSIIAPDLLHHVKHELYVRLMVDVALITNLHGRRNGDVFIYDSVWLERDIHVHDLNTHSMETLSY